MSAFKPANFAFLPNVPKELIAYFSFELTNQKPPLDGGFDGKKGTFFLLNNGVFLSVFCLF